MWPYQHLNSVAVGSQEYLLAAAGPELLVVDQSGIVVTQWSSVEVSQTTQEDGQRSAKRQKTDIPTNIILLEVIHDYDHILVVTEDKNIHVLKIDGAGHLAELSRRCMPKRSCAVRIVPERSLILCADKFGDVYSLPLIPDPEEEAKYANGEAEDLEKPKKAFTPSATPLTVHTQRNLKALESQKRQEHKQRKGPLAFEHKILLGHVSMLTDLAWVSDKTAGARIITADRDEHIRVSRPPPQSYVIEGFCLGHTEFISKVCAIPGTTTLVSGGGDDWLGVWDWSSYQLLAKVDANHALAAAGIKNPDKHGKIAVTSMQYVSVGNGSAGAVVVLFEKLQAVMLVDTTTYKTVVHKTAAIPLATTQLGGSIVIAIDDRTSTGARIQAASLTGRPGSVLTMADLNANAELRHLNESTTAEADDSSLDRSLYSTGLLRKRGGWDEPQAEEED